MTRTAARHLSFSRSPHGYPSKNTVSLWHRIVIPCFLGCLFLFLRAVFGFGSPASHLDPLSTTSNSRIRHTFDLRLGSSDSALRPNNALIGVELPHSLLVSNWSPAEAMNLTMDLELARVPKEGEEYHTVMSVPLTPSGKALSVLAMPDSQPCRLLDLTSAQHVSIKCAISLDHKTQEDKKSDHRHGRAMGEESVDRNYDPLDMDLFFATEEFDGEGQNIALKVWIDRNDILRAKFGRAGLCQASSGVQCSEYPRSR